MAPKKPLKLKHSPHNTRHHKKSSKKWYMQFWAWGLALILLFLFLASDGFHHWDGACFLAEAAYGREEGFRCLWLDHFRLHVELVDILVGIFGVAKLGYLAITLIYALLIVLSSYILVKTADQLHLLKKQPRIKDTYLQQLFFSCH